LPTTAIYTRSLHDALPISPALAQMPCSLRRRRMASASRRWKAMLVVLGSLWVGSPLVWVWLMVVRMDCSRRSRIAASFLGVTHRSEEHTSELQSPYDLVCR